MPVENGLGYSDYTRHKQIDFRGFLVWHLNMCRNLLGRHGTEPYYEYLDLNAGPGYYEDITGSPIIFLDAVEEQKLPFRAFFVEKEAEHASRLRAYVVMRSANAHIIIGDHNEVCRTPELMNGGPRYGLLYTDPTGEAPPFDLLAELSELPRYERIDFLLSCAATPIKRVRAALGRRSLEEYLSSIRKDYWLVRRAFGKYQWTFLLGTNWQGFPEWQKRGFYRLTSAIGQKILLQLNNTAAERTNMMMEEYGGQQLALPLIR